LHEKFTKDCILICSGRIHNDIDQEIRHTPSTCFNPICSLDNLHKAI